MVAAGASGGRISGALGGAEHLDGKDLHGGNASAYNALPGGPRPRDSERLRPRDECSDSVITIKPPEGLFVFGWPARAAVRAAHTGVRRRVARTEGSAATAVRWPGGPGGPFCLWASRW